MSTCSQNSKEVPPNSSNLVEESIYPLKKNTDEKVHPINRLLRHPLTKAFLLFFPIGIRFISSLRRRGKLSLKHLIESRWTGWFFENGFVLLIALVRARIPLPTAVETRDENGKDIPLQHKIKTICRNILISLVSCLVTEEGTVLALKLLDAVVYKKVPYFTKQKKNTKVFSVVSLFDWLSGNAYLQVLGGGIALGLIESFVPKRWAEEINQTEFSMIKFMRNFVLFRVVADAVFYYSHRAMHIKDSIYKMVHKKHHGHYVTNITTNYHFTAIDLFAESAFPMFTAMAAIRGCGFKMGRFELHLLMGYWAWYSLGSHFGKPVKLISMFPPISPLYNFVYPIDDYAIEFHERHHNRRHGNYGLTSWMDKLLGTELPRLSRRSK
mmetsp:Transcript_2354/g.2680  ORF Transcript_2354/g.2680 Transcript_2354/m.2680 type:complete len:382 (-) Transcript_2354:349-1494(-)